MAWGGKGQRAKLVFLLCVVVLPVSGCPYEGRKAQLDAESVKCIDGSDVRSGDIIFRRMDGVLSDLASSISRRDKRYSHVGLAIREGSEVFVIHASEDHGRVVKEHLCDFLRGSERFLIIRPKEDPVNVNIPSLLGRPFDYHFNMRDHKKLYCTELVAMFYPSIPSIPSPIGMILPIDSVLSIPHRVVAQSSDP